MTSRQPPAPHLNRLLAPIAAPARENSDCPPAALQTWLDQLESVADQIWRDAWNAGAAHVMSLKASRIVVVDNVTARSGVRPTDSDDQISQLRAAINRRIGLAQAAAVDGDGSGFLRPADTIRLCEFNLSLVDLFAEARESKPTAGRARGRLSAYSTVIQNMAAAYKEVDPTL